jgi:phage-related protein
MTELKTHVNNENGTYEVTMVTDKKESYSLVQYLIRGLIDNRHCSVIISDNPDSSYIDEVVELESEK